MKQTLISVVAATTLLGAGIAASPAAASSAASHAPTVALAVDSPATMGSWTAPFRPPGGNIRVIGVHSVMMYTGKVLLFGNLRPTVGYVYDPVTGNAVEADPPVDVECGGMTPLADGRILVVGGHAKGATGIENILLFNPRTSTWTPQPNSPLGRYYPTTTRLADGRVLITGGFDAAGKNNPNVELYTPPPAGQNVGTLQLLGQQHSAGLYPRQWVMPDGQVLEAKRSSFKVTTSTFVWTALAKTQANHHSGYGAVLLPGPTAGSTKVMMIGGGDPTGSTAATETYDYANPGAGWTLTAPMPHPRTHMSPVIMPDGTILTIGGNNQNNFLGPEYDAQSYNPQTNTWTSLASQVERRGYHSSAILLPDGRVLSAGDTGSGGGGNTMEIYSPAYLFGGARPTITSAPSQVNPGDTFTIQTPDTTSKAILLAPAAATHTTDFSQRMVTLGLSAGSGQISATVPSANVALSGWYMLFLVNGSGVPSVASWIHVG
jgi:galactose oxidase-like protein